MPDIVTDTLAVLNLRRGTREFHREAWPRRSTPAKPARDAEPRHQPETPAGDTMTAFTAAAKPFDFTPLLAAGLPAPAVRWNGFPKYNFVGGHNDAAHVPVDELVAAAG